MVINMQGSKVGQREAAKIPNGFATLAVMRSKPVISPDQLICCCDRPPKQVVILHSEVRNATIKLCNIEDGQKVCCVEEGGIGGKASQCHIVVMCSDAFIACINKSSMSDITSCERAHVRHERT